MTDWTTVAMTGFFTGVGVSLANYLTDRWLKHKYDAIFNKGEQIKNNFKEQILNDLSKKDKLDLQKKLEEELGVEKHESTNM